MVYHEKNNMIKIAMIIVISILFLTAFVYIAATIFKKEEKTKIINPTVNIAEKVKKTKIK
jgi:flagellar basal body-associated protein FliL